MRPTIIVSGKIDLITVYTNEAEKVYYARLIGNIETKNVRAVPPQLRLDIPITEQHYNTLKEEIAKSGDKYPVLRFHSELGLVVNNN